MIGISIISVNQNFRFNIEPKKLKRRLHEQMNEGFVISSYHFKYNIDSVNVL